MGDQAPRLTLGGKPLLEGALEQLAQDERAANGDSELVVYGVAEQRPGGAQVGVGVAYLRPSGWQFSSGLTAAIEDGSIDHARLTFAFRKRVK